MTQDAYPDRAEWPRYWRMIRSGVTALVVIVVVVGGAAFLPRPSDPVWRGVTGAAVAIVAALASAAAIRAVNAWWARRSA